MTGEQEALELVAFEVWFREEFGGEKFTAWIADHAIAYNAWMARAAKDKANT